MTLKTKKRLHQQSVNSKHSWRVGELCTAVYDNLSEGVIYRVTKSPGLHRALFTLHIRCWVSLPFLGSSLTSRESEPETLTRDTARL